MTTHVTAIIAAAGEGQRMGGSVPKPYVSLAGRPIVLRTLDRCLAAASIKEVILVVAASELRRCEMLLTNDPALKGRPWRCQSGGATRQESVKRGLEALDSTTEIVLIHDAARPLVSPDLIDRCVQLTAEKGAVVLGVPVRDTIKVVSKDHWIQSTPDRNSLWEIQTPQVFHRELIMEAHRTAAQAKIQATDDAMLVERIGKPVFVLAGNRSNLKITTAEDIAIAEALIERSVFR
jgi:2-C-methyl-D-erythritol 4-phosphate cytidylyltransferase